MCCRAIFAFSIALSLVIPSIRENRACTVNSFPKKLFHARNRHDLAIVRPPGVDPGGFMLTPDSVWYCQVLLLFFFSAMTNTGSRSFEYALVSVIERYKGPMEYGYICIIVSS
jgi:hypothetical protein